MNKWLESHSYYAEWIAALAVLPLMWRESVRPLLASGTHITSVAIGYMTLCAVLIHLRFFASKETVKEVVNVVLVIVCCYAFAKSFKADQQQQPAQT